MEHEPDQIKLLTNDHFSPAVERAADFETLRRYVVHTAGQCLSSILTDIAHPQDDSDRAIEVSKNNLTNCLHGCIKKAREINCTEVHIEKLNTILGTISMTDFRNKENVQVLMEQIRTQ